MKKLNLFYFLFAALIASLTFIACEDDNAPDSGPTETDYTDLLTNQVNQVILPTMVNYQSKMNDLSTAVDGFASTPDEASLTSLKSAYQEAYLAYQAAAVHNYFATANQALVTTSNLYPVDIGLLEKLIEAGDYNFTTEAQERANGFPALDYLLYGHDEVLTFFSDGNMRMAFLQELVAFLKSKADALVDQWSGSLNENFINNGGTALGSSISVQLNETLVYYENHVRENKVGIPIGRLGPNDSPIAPDATKIEAYYQSLTDGNEDFTLALLRAAIEEMEDTYLGETPTGIDDQGYDDLLLAREQSSIDMDIKNQFQTIYEKIDSRTSISGDESLYNEIQILVTLYKSDLFPLLNIQDADGANDGD